MQAEALRIPDLTAQLPAGLTRDAAVLSEILPHLVIEAKKVSAQLTMGVHGRKRAGPGEEFWEFRPFTAGESASRVDWRRSARDDRLYVREREWQSASNHWLSIDLSRSMQFRSKLGNQPKRDRALVLGLALADMLVHGGERVGLLGATNAMAARGIILRLADAILRLKPEPEADSIPRDIHAKRQDHLIIISDFIQPLDFIRERLARIAGRGHRATLVLIRDPAEEAFPFSGEIEFEGLEADSFWRVGEASDIAAAYRARITAHGAELRRMALSHGFGFVRHHTDRPASEAILAIAALISGVAGSTRSGTRS